MDGKTEDGRSRAMTAAVVKPRRKYATAPTPCPVCYAPMIDDVKPGRATIWRCKSPGHGAR